MKKWQNFEIKCCEYLNKTYGTDRVYFVLRGGSISVPLDIEVFIDGENKFNIEVKSSKAQSGQFVVLNQNGKLVFSSLNKSNAEDADIFIEYMNEHFEMFEKASTAGVNLDLDLNQINKWIINHYLSKNSQFVITHDGSSFVIFPTTKYGEYFQTTCKYRIKKSGSQEVPKKVTNLVVSLFGGTDYKYIDNKKLCVKSNNYGVKDKLSFEGYDYFVSKQYDDFLYIRRLSNTFNPNVIFSVELKTNQVPSDLNIFKEALS